MHVYYVYTLHVYIYIRVYIINHVVDVIYIYICIYIYTYSDNDSSVTFDLNPTNVFPRGQQGFKCEGTWEMDDETISACLHFEFLCFRAKILNLLPLHNFLVTDMKM